MKKGWEIKKLGDISDIKTGKSNAVDADINGKYTFFDRSKKIKRSNRYLFDCEALIIPGEGSQFFPRYYSGKFDLHQRVYSISNFHKSINIRFVEYFLIFNHKHFENVAVGATVKSLRLRHFTEIEIPLPPLPEQQQIVALLDKAFTAIATAKENAQQNLLNAKELFENSLQLLFDNKNWEHKKLGEIATFKNGMNFTKSSKGQSVEIVGVKNFKNNFWVPFQELEEVVIDGKFNEAYLLKEGDIITVRSNGNPKLIGRTLLADSVTGNITHSGFTIRIRLNSDVLLPLFLCHYLKTQKTRKELVDSGNGVGIKSLNQGSLSSLMIPFPKSKDEQQQIVKKLNSLSAETKKLEAIYQQKINDLEELKKSLLQRAFNGELKMEN
ncbi:MAG: restriction endonuclease subunit S [Flavobacteriaceae bacterium]|nr:restriction endonuclease subunit S [Flavobacteriaceae bacterium]